MNKSLFEQAVAVIEDYLGPAAPRFLARQVSFHLGKAPADLTRDDIPRLVEWTRATLVLLTSDKALVQECVARLSELGTSDRKR